MKKPWLLLIIPIFYIFILAATKGGSLLSGIYGDIPCYVSSGLSAIGAGGYDIQTQPPVLPLYSALLYLITGFYSFINLLWTWNFLIMSIFIISAYLVAEKLLKNRWLAVFASFIVGFNWHIGWYGQHFLTDTAVASFSMLAFAVLLYALEKKNKFLMLASGAIAALSFWTKFSGLALGMGLVIIFALFECIRNKYSFREGAKILAVIAIGIFIGSVPFFALNISRGLTPLSQWEFQNAYAPKSEFSLCREPFSSNLGSWDCGIIFYILRIPYSLGLVVSVLAAIGFIATFWRLAKNRKMSDESFIFGWFLILFLLYSFILPFVIEQYMVHITIWLILLSAIGLKCVYDKTAGKFGDGTALKIAAVLALLAIITTNSAYPLFVFNIREMSFRDPLFLHNRLPERADNSELYELADKIKAVDSKNVSIQIGYGADCYLSIAARREMLPQSDFVIGKNLPENATEVAGTKNYIAYWRNEK